jgi:putative sigma-54 modulation protein
MRIDVKGRNTPVTEELRELVERRFKAVAAQLPEHAWLEVEVREERNPAIADCMVAAATLHMRGRTLRASDAADSMRHAVVLCSQEITRQVKSTREKRRHIREARGIRSSPGTSPAV